MIALSNCLPFKNLLCSKKIRTSYKVSNDDYFEIGYNIPANKIKIGSSLVVLDFSAYALHVVGKLVIFIKIDVDFTCNS